MIARVTHLALAAASLLAGGLVGLSACDWCRCGDPVPIDTGTYQIVESIHRPELVGGMVEVSDGRVELSFTAADGHDWVIDYVVEDIP